MDELAVVPGRDNSGQSIFAVLVKRSYEILPGRTAERAERSIPLLKADVYYDDGDAETSTVKYESDLAPYKLATDFVVVGKAYAPGGRPVETMDASLQVAGHSKVLRVTGDRRCIHRPEMSPGITEPAAFTELEIRYDRAYGGEDLRSDPELPFYYPRNYRGKGVAVRNLREVVDGLLLPNIEDPQDLLTPDRIILGAPDRWNAQPLPHGFGWFQRTWYPRCSFVGAVPGLFDPDTVMREEQLGLVPKGQIALARRFKLPSFDAQFNNGASLGLALPYLQGGEEVRLTGLSPDGSLHFRLPAERPRIVLDIGLGENELPAVLHTTCVRMEQGQLDVVWRGAHVYPGVAWLPEMQRMVAEVVWR
jgi:hypothetical protein